MEGSYPSIVSEAKDTTAFASDGAPGEVAVVNQLQESKKPRGRPKKATEGDASAKKGRGRPKKAPSDETNGQKSAAIEVAAESLRKAGEPLAPEFPESALQCDLTDGTGTAAGDGIPKVKRGRGRPRKNPGQPATTKAPKSDGPKRGRGRPRKYGAVGQPRKRPADASEQETSPKKPKNNDEAGESDGKKGPGRPKKAPTAETPAVEDQMAGTDSPKKKAGRPKKNQSSSQNGSEAAGAAVAKKRGRPPKDAQSEGNGQASPAKSGRPRGRPKKAVQGTSELGAGEGEGKGEGKVERMQVSFSDSESEESEALGKGVQRSNILSALSAEQQQAAIGATAGNIQHHPTAREPAFINKFDESFDEDSDN